jgi:hypothetical protein
MLTTMVLQRYTLEPQPGMRMSIDIMEGRTLKPMDQDIVVKKR